MDNWPIQGSPNWHIGCWDSSQKNLNFIAELIITSENIFCFLFSIFFPKQVSQWKTDSTTFWMLSWVPILWWKQKQERIVVDWFFSKDINPLQLYISRSLYSSGTLSGSTGLGRKCVNFWCLLDLAPSLGVPSLLSATKYLRPVSPCLYMFDE